MNKQTTAKTTEFQQTKQKHASESEHIPQTTFMRDPQRSLMVLQDAAGNQAVSRLVRSTGRNGQNYGVAIATSGLLQRKCACGGTAGRDGECAECRKKRLQRKAVQSDEPATVPPIVQEVLHSPGQPLDPPTRAFMEQRFNQYVTQTPVSTRIAKKASPGLTVAPATDVYEREADQFASRVMTPGLPTNTAVSPGVDFSQVRIHTDARAADSARAVNALAYTVGHDVVLGEGQYAPATAVGKRLLAHELTHVIQQAAHSGLARTVQRNACAHDTAQGSGCGRIVGTDESGEETQFPADRLIAEALPSKFGGQWVAQLYSPPNAAKGGKLYGQVDAVKVKTDKNLTLEVAEIKSRNNGMGTGGCALATAETQGYITAIKPLAPRMAAISQGLEKIGGLMLPDCRSFNKEIKKKLTDAGIDTIDRTDMDAWCVLNSVQTRLKRKFTKGFTAVEIIPNQDGTRAEDYTAVLFPINCSGNKPGVFRMIFQVNQKGGMSYRCEKTCTEKKRKELEKQLEKESSREIEIQTQTGKKKYTFDEPIGDEDPGEDSRVEFGPEGIDVTDVAIWGTGAVAAMTALHIAMSKAKTKAEQTLIRKTAEKLTQELARRGAPEVAKLLDSQNISKLGTKAYQEALKKGEAAAQKRILAAGEKRLAKKLAEKGLKKGAKTAAKKLVEKGAKAILYIGAIITAVELLGAADAYAKGAEIQFGLDGGDADLAGDTQIKTQGDKPKDGPTTDAKLKDTQIDIDLAKAPDVQGTLEIEAQKVTIKGKVGADDTPVLVNLKVKLENTTIIYTNTGRFKGGKVLLDGALDIQDSTIEIDLPKDATLDAIDMTSAHEIKGVKLKVTKVGSGSGQGKDAGAAKAGDKDKADEKKEPLNPEEKKLLDQVTKDEKLKKIYENLLGAKGIKPDKAMLERFLALKARLDAHPELVDEIIKKTVKEELTDPIKQIIEPMERLLAEAEKKQSPKKDATPSPTETTDPAAANAQQDKANDKPSAQKQGETATGPTQAEKAKATVLSFWSLFDQDKVKAGRAGIDDSSTPSATAASPMTLVYGKHTYKFTFHGTLKSPIAKPSPGLLWEGNYEFKPPAKLIQAEGGGHPIYFSDAATGRELKYGAFKPDASTKKKAKKK